MTQPRLTLVEIGTCDEPGLESWSPFCFKAHRSLQLARLKYARKICRMPAEAKPYNPTGQFPTLLVDDKPIPDTSDILREIEKITGGALTAGLDARARAEAWTWEEYGDTTLNGYMLAARWADPDNWPRARAAVLADVPALLRAVGAGFFRRGIVKKLIARDIWRAGPEVCWRRYGEQLDQLEARAPETGFWMGDKPTVADVSLFAHLRSTRTRLCPRQAGEIEKRKKLNTYVDRMDQASRVPEMMQS